MVGHHIRAPSNNDYRPKKREILLMSSNQPSRGESSDPVSTAFTSFFGALASQVVIITAVLYYFGWLEIQAYFNYFGLDTSLLAFNTTDYVLRSVRIAVPALVVAAIVIITTLVLNNAVLTYLGNRANSSRVRYVRLLPLALRLGAILAGLMLVSIIVPNSSGTPYIMLLPLLLLTGSVLFLYSLQAADVLNSSSPGLRQPQYQITLALVVVAILWALSLYAIQVGRNNAVVDSVHGNALPSVVLYTTQRLAIAGSGVDVREINLTNSKYHFQYSGLRLLTRNGDRLFLIPAGWLRDRDSAFILRESDDLRADIRTR